MLVLSVLAQHTFQVVKSGGQRRSQRLRVKQLHAFGLNVMEGSFFFFFQPRQSVSAINFVLSFCLHFAFYVIILKAPHSTFSS